ncbi:MAG: isoprenyl transferase [Bacteroidota bacterium]
MDFKAQVNTSKFPEHVAVIMDGNGRWAQQKGYERVYGHKHGVRSVRNISEAAAEIGIKYLTLYSFSKENWNRPDYEVNALMSLLVETINSEIDTLIKNQIRLRIIGDLNSLPENVTKNLWNAIDKTSGNNRMDLILALSYGSRWEIINAVKQIDEKVKKEEIKPEQINEDVFSNHLTTANIPNPELLIRTGGEKRASNFLLWQISYTELYFTDVLWPDFQKNHFYEALVEFQNRKRRFGKIKEQIENDI